MEKEKKYTVRICEDYVLRDPDKVKGILERVSKIISNSYIESNRNHYITRTRAQRGRA